MFLNLTLLGFSFAIPFLNLNSRLKNIKNQQTESNDKNFNFINDDDEKLISSDSIEIKKIILPEKTKQRSKDFEAGSFENENPKASRSNSKKIKRFFSFNAFFDGKHAKKCKENYCNKKGIDNPIPIIDINSVDNFEFTPELHKRERFITEMKKFITYMYSQNVDWSGTTAIGYIYDQLKMNTNELFIFFAIVLYNTDGMQFLEELDCDEIYKSRGLLMLNCKENYELMANLTKNSDWVNKPEKLGFLSMCAVEATVRYWKYFTNGSETRYIELLRRLNIEEALPEAKDCEVLRKRLAKRTFFYDKICRHFDSAVIL
ncbi:hypothetical protein GVAV_000470 [Gurleya vavrai]